MFLLADLVFFRDIVCGYLYMRGKVELFFIVFFLMLDIDCLLFLDGWKGVGVSGRVGSSF